MKMKNFFGGLAAVLLALIILVGLSGSMNC